jgi:hypothetical protein
LNGLDFTSFDEYPVQHKAQALMGKAWPGDSEAGRWSFGIVGSTDSNMLTADGFIWTTYLTKADVVPYYQITVTYKMDRLDVADNCLLDDLEWTVLSEGSYNPSAGYEVYRTSGP